MITTISNIPPQVSQCFFPLLTYGTLGRLKYTFEKYVLPLSKKKIRAQDTGKRKIFDIMKQDFWLLYERKKIEEIDIKEKITKIAKERSCIPITSTIKGLKRI